MTSALIPMWTGTPICIDCMTIFIDQTTQMVVRAASFV